MNSKFPLRCYKNSTSFYLLLNLVEVNLAFIKTTVELSVLLQKPPSLVSISLRVLKEYSWLYPWLFPWPDYEEEYLEDGPQEGYYN